MHARRRLRILILTYFWVLILEGALRKWIVPQLSNPLLIIRDPLAVMICALAWYRGLYPRNGYMHVINTFAILFFVVGIVQIVWRADLNPLVVAYGWRTYVLHLPVIFISAEILTFEDIRLLGTWCCRIAGVMIVICVAQYYARSAGFLNAGTMADYDRTQIAFEGEHVRPSGTFSFTTGVANYFALTAAFAICRLMVHERRRAGRTMAYCALASAAAYIPLSGGRLGILMVGIVLTLGAILSIRRSLSNPKTWAAGAVVLAAIAIVAQTAVFQGIWGSMEARLVSARMVEDAELKWGFATRIFGGFLSPITDFGEVPMFVGKGLGLGTQVGSALQLGSVGDFLTGEGEWGRILGECGWFLGMVYVAFRVWLASDLFLRALRVGWALSYWAPLLLWSAGAWTILQGQLGQPTNLGFFVIDAAAVLVALKGAERVPPSLGQVVMGWSHRPAAAEIHPPAGPELAGSDRT